MEQDRHGFFAIFAGTRGLRTSHGLAAGHAAFLRPGHRGAFFRLRGGDGYLWRLLHEEPELLDGAFVADKVVGKGAAALMAAGRVRELFADVVSHAALELLNGAGIPVSYTVAVPHIINRAGDGICPVERLCAGARTAAECLPLIEGFLTAGKGAP